MFKNSHPVLSSSFPSYVSHCVRCKPRWKLSSQARNEKRMGTQQQIMLNLGSGGCRRKFGEDLHYSFLLYESFEEPLADATLKAQTLAHVVSVALQANGNPPGFHLVQSKRRLLSTVPTDTDVLHTKYDIISNCRLLVRRGNLSADFTRTLPRTSAQTSTKKLCLPVTSI